MREIPMKALLKVGRDTKGGMTAALALETPSGPALFTGTVPAAEVEKIRQRAYGWIHQGHAPEASARAAVMGSDELLQPSFARPSKIKLVRFTDPDATLQPNWRQTPRAGARRPGPDDTLRPSFRSAPRRRAAKPGPNDTITPDAMKGAVRDACMGLALARLAEKTPAQCKPYLRGAAKSALMGASVEERAAEWTRGQRIPDVDRVPYADDLSHWGVNDFNINVTPVAILSGDDVGSIWGKIKKAGKSVGRGVSKGARAVGRGAKKVGKTTLHVADLATSPAQEILKTGYSAGKHLGHAGMSMLETGASAARTLGTVARAGLHMVEDTAHLGLRVVKGAGGAAKFLAQGASAGVHALAHAGEGGGGGGEGAGDAPALPAMDPAASDSYQAAAAPQGGGSSDPGGGGGGGGAQDDGGGGGGGGGEAADDGSSYAQDGGAPVDDGAGPAGAPVTAEQEAALDEASEEGASTARDEAAAALDAGNVDGVGAWGFQGAVRRFRPRAKNDGIDLYDSESWLDPGEIDELAKEMKSEELEQLDDDDPLAPGSKIALMGMDPVALYRGAQEAASLGRTIKKHVSKRRRAPVADLAVDDTNQDETEQTMSDESLGWW